MRASDALVVWKLDRLGRSLPNLLSIIADLKKKGVAFRSLTEQMDTTTPHGELLFSVFGALAQYERALTRERVMAGLAAAKRRGRRGGRPLAIDPEKLEQIVAALESGAGRQSFGLPRVQSPAHNPHRHASARALERPGGESGVIKRRKNKFAVVLSNRAIWN